MLSSSFECLKTEENHLDCLRTLAVSVTTGAQKVHIKLRKFRKLTLVLSAKANDRPTFSVVRDCQTKANQALQTSWALQQDQWLVLAILGALRSFESTW